MKQFIVDAFSDRIFHGNPAAVCILEQPLSDELMQNIAIENNLSETALPSGTGAVMICAGLRPAARFRSADTQRLQPRLFCSGSMNPARRGWFSVL